MSNLKRQRRRFAEREIVFCRWPAGSSVRELLEAADRLERPPDVLYTIGPAPGVADLRAIAGGDPGPGWAAEAHYLTLPAPVLRFRRDSGGTLEVHRAASYFGEGDYSPGEAREARNLLRALVRGAFNEGELLTTPASTGRYLLARSISGDREWPTLELDTQDFLRATTGQGRIEMFGRTGDAPLVQYDGRLAYGALCSSVPAGEPRRDTLDLFAGWRAPGRYRVRFIVPARWERECECGAPGHAGIGLLPVRGEDRWEWPSAPGVAGVSWVDGREVAIAYAHGWRVQILERLLYPMPPYPPATRANGQPTYRGPLDAWAKKLGDLRRIDARRDLGVAGELVNRGLRAILLNGIGALHGTPRRVVRSVSRDEAVAGAIPETATDVLPLGDRFVWTEREAPAWPEMSHPEWTTTIWGRARAALLDCATPGGGRAGMLHVPAETVVGCFTDALYLSADPEWPDDGRVGRLRRVWADSASSPLPTTALELRRRKARA